MTEHAELEDMMTPRDSDGKRIPKSRHLDTLEEPVYIVEPNWGDARQWNEDFAGEDVDAMDPDKIAKMLRNVVKKPDMSNISGDKIEDMRSAVVQELVDLIMEESGLIEEEEGETKN